MDKKTTQRIKVGMFVSVGIIFAMGFIFFISEKSIFERHYSLYSHFDEAQGLRNGAPIFLAGIQVGTVAEIMFPDNLEDKGVLVKMEIARKYQERIREDSEATVATQGLLGDKAILVSIGTTTAKALGDNSYLKTKKGPSIEGFAEKTEGLINDVQKMVDSLNGILGDLKDKKSMLHSLLYDPEGGDIIGELADMTRSASKLVRDMRQSGMVQNFADASKNMKSTTQNLNQMTAKIDKGEGSVGGLINDPTVYYDLKTLLGKANRSKLLKAVIRHVLSKNEKDTLK